MKLLSFAGVFGEKLADPEFTDEIEPFANSRFLSFNRFVKVKSFITKFSRQKIISQFITEPKCQGYWTKWYNRDSPAGSGDHELLAFLRHENPTDTELCQAPIGVDARIQSTRQPYQ